MKRRSRRSVAATLAAIGLFALCAFAVTVSVQVLMDPRRWRDVDNALAVLNSVRWGDIVVLAAAVGVGVVGLVLLLAALVPGRLVVVPLAPDDTGIAAGVGRRSLGSALRRTTLAVDGVSAVRVKRRRRKVIAAVRTTRTVTDGLADAERTAVDRALDGIDLRTRPTVAVKVRRSKP
ncbi:DUF6286 domain-containing protein [Kutzneria sp. NPDC052558]|uniref:DUF6286 domain-containing protein n=1 Tax=Kutzneria sp. NPDC052558 TaxID=3364121 RepID=UPI0037C8E5D4